MGPPNARTDISPSRERFNIFLGFFPSSIQSRTYPSKLLRDHAASSQIDNEASPFISAQPAKRKRVFAPGSRKPSALAGMVHHRLSCVRRSVCGALTLVNRRITFSSPDVYIFSLRLGSTASECSHEPIDNLDELSSKGNNSASRLCETERPSNGAT